MTKLLDTSTLPPAALNAFEGFRAKSAAMAKNFARTYPWVDADDLASVAAIASWHACLKIKDGMHSSQVDSFISNAVRWELIDEIRKHSHATKSERKARESYVQAVIAIEQRLGREAELAEIQAQMDMGADEFESFLSLVSPSLRGLIGAQDDFEAERATDRPCLIAAEMPDRTEANAGDAAETQDEVARLMRAIALLEPDERRVIQAVYLDGRKSKDVAAETGLSTGRVSQIHSKAMARLRGFLQRSEE